MVEIKPGLALAEKARREKARRHLVDFSTYVAPWYKPARHHRLVGEKLEQVERYIRTRGKEGIGRLMVFEPPRYGKTEQVCRLGPAWMLGKNPDMRVILTSYGADLAQEDSKAVRDYVLTEKYRALFGDLSTMDEAVALSDDSTSRAKWDLGEPHRGGVVAAGIGGGIVGKGANLLVIDDPFKNRSEAESEAYRRKVWSWYKSAAYTRLEDGAAVVVMHTRWDPDDLAGKLLVEMANDPLLADQWEIVFLPAVALEESEYAKDEADFQQNMLRGLYVPQKDQLGRKAGEALWPEKYDAGTLARQRAILGDEFPAQYQQMPRAAHGNFFDEEQFEVVDLTPRPPSLTPLRVGEAPGKGEEEYVPGIQWCVYVDLALGEKATSDWNAAVVTGLDEATGIVYYRDMLHVQDLDEFLRELEEWMVLPSERGTIWGFEDVAFQKLVLKEMLRKPRLANLAMIAIRPNGDKVERARPIQLRARMGKVKLVRGAWVRGCLNEMVLFPRGAHDDQVDTMSGGLQMIAEPAEQMVTVVYNERVSISDY